ncbi:hypothetical protein CEXT_708471 [Caerostris extrusa]|uniref:Uncharacterized protein n=1 Tax=Caerostris extrusa TaxID=172846 RepID=A0AAV4VEA0_CAEEX|nr:hypothetical protein CEXT_708471 [Caerostris extrusa]
MTPGNRMKELLLTAYSDENLINPSTDGSHSIIFSRQHEEEQNSANVSEILLQAIFIFAIATEKNLKGLANWLILSFGCCRPYGGDIGFATSAYNEVNQQIWSLDLNSEFGGGSSIISFAPVFDGKDPDFYRRLEADGRKRIEVDLVQLLFLLKKNNPGGSASTHFTEDQSEGKDSSQAQVSENGIGTNPAGLGRLIVLAKREKSMSRNPLKPNAKEKQPKHS